MSPGPAAYARHHLKDRRSLGPPCVHPRNGVEATTVVGTLQLDPSGVAERRNRRNRDRGTLLTTEAGIWIARRVGSPCGRGHAADGLQRSICQKVLDGDAQVLASVSASAFEPGFLRV